MACLLFIVVVSFGNRPNDPKLSDGGGWRGPCMAGGKAAAEARAVTAGAVRCSAWLGVFGDCMVVFWMFGRWRSGSGQAGNNLGISSW